MIWHGLATYDLNGVERPGLVVDNKLYDLAQLALAGQPEQTIGMPVDGLLDAWDAWVPRLSSLAEQAPGLAAQGRLTAIEGAACALPYRPRHLRRGIELLRARRRNGHATRATRRASPTCS